jgi:hypothetical protein
VIAVGENRTAMLREKSSGRIHRVERGKEINGITIEKIGATEVTLAMNGERETLAMTVQKAAGPGGATAGAAPAAAPQQGPFTAEAPATPGSPASPVARGASPDPAAAARPRGSAYAPATGTPGRPNAPQATTQPMTPEELLARRRARRNQPTQ